MSLKVVSGLVLGAVLGWWIKQRHQIVHKGPSSAHIKQHVYYDEDRDQHYSFHPVTHVCPPSVDIDALEHSSDEEEES